jgi:hyaluronan synthase
LIDGLIVSYGLLCLILLALRMILAQAYRWRRLRVVASETAEPSADAMISIIYPVYNESAEVMRRVMDGAKACLEQTQIEIIIVDDGSTNRSDLVPVYQAFQHSRLRVLYQQNRGKRRAQCAGLAVARGEYIVTVDSDTLITPENVRRLIAPLQHNRRIGAVCGEVSVTNSSTNLLTRLIERRYWTAFNLERAAQSLFQSVLCCSGPFSAYRASLLHQIKDAYVSQTFCGQTCTYGDDRHLTNLVLGEGYQVVYEPGVVASTLVPETLGEYIKQQNRWNKSFYREMLWTLKIADRVHLYALFDMLVQPMLFIGFSMALAHMLLLLIQTHDIALVGTYLAALVTMASLRALYGLLCTRDLGFLLFVLYGFLHVFVLIPLRFKSILTLTDNHWGTREVDAVGPYGNFAAWAVGYCGVLAVGAALMSLGIEHQLTDAVGVEGSAFGATITVWLLNPVAAGGCWLGALGVMLGLGIAAARQWSKRLRRQFTLTALPDTTKEAVGSTVSPSSRV